MAKLFEPFSLRGLRLPNRIVISPMCEYSAIDGCATDWHIIHLGHLALSGAGLLIIEATGVEPQGRITRECLGLYSDANEAALGRALRAVRTYSDMPIGIQLGHAGRKASQERPIDGAKAVPESQGGWQVDGPSPIPFAEGWKTPRALDRAGMERIIAAFADATRRADRLGIDLIELHGAHGYLLSSFLSPLANRREDDYGGPLANRMRFPLEAFRAVRAAWPQHKPLGVRFNGSDWTEGGVTIDEAVVFAKALADLGCDYLDVSSGGNSPAQKVPASPGYQVPFAARIKAEVGIGTMTVGLIREPRQAEEILVKGEADLIALGRAMLADPRWPWRAALELDAKLPIPHQYMRGAPPVGIPALNPRPLRQAAE